VSTKNIVSKDFSWSTNATFSKSKLEITKLETNARILDFITGEGYASVGHENMALFSIPFVRLDAEGIPLFITDDDGNIGRYVYFQDRDNVHFLKYEGPSEPNITGGLGNTLRYKNFRLNLFVTYSFGNKLRLPTVFASSYSDLSSMPKEFYNRWVLPGDENYTNIPAIMTTRESAKESSVRYAYSAYNYSDVRVADGGFVRLKDVSLTYDVPNRILSAIKAKNISVKLQATNVLLLYADDKLNGADPEYFQSGGVSHPVPKQYTLTLQLGF
jgi:hypothetical protein